MTPPDCVSAFGDSLSAPKNERWPLQLSIPTASYAVGGQTSVEGHDFVVAYAAAAADSTYTFVSWAANDIIQGFCDAGPECAAQSYQNALDLDAVGNTVVLLIQNPLYLLFAEGTPHRTTQDDFNLKLAAFNQHLLDLNAGLIPGFEGKGFPVVFMEDAFAGEPDPSIFFIWDGFLNIHPTPAGSLLVAQEIEDFLGL